MSHALLASQRILMHKAQSIVYPEHELEITQVIRDKVSKHFEDNDWSTYIKWDTTLPNTMGVVIVSQHSDEKIGYKVHVEVVDAKEIISVL